jgi:hypothetical protein
LCLLLNRRARSVRVIDFRAGHNPAKRALVASLNQREGVERVFIVAEREEAAAWSRLGLAREGTIPGFYKRSDAFVLGALLEGDTGERSGTRAAHGTQTVSSEAVYQAARRRTKDFSIRSARAVRVKPVTRAELESAVAAALCGERPLTGFEPFGRGAERLYHACTVRGGCGIAASVEIQPCFDNAFVELLSGPVDERSIAHTAEVIVALCERLLERGVVGCFAVSPGDDSKLAAAYLAAGFRRTGLLVGHYRFRRQRVDGFLWSRKLASVQNG